MKITGSSNSQPVVITLSDDQVKLIAEKISGIIFELIQAGVPVKSAGDALVKKYQIDNSVVDVGVSLDGIEASGPMVEKTVSQDSAEEAKNKLKNLKKK